MAISRSDLLGKTDVKKALMKLAVPAIFAMGVTALYNLVDTIFVGRGAGEIAIGALSIANPVQMIVIAFSLMIGVGSASVFSRAFGRDDQQAMETVVNTALILGIVVSLLIAGVGIFFLDDLLYFFGATDGNIGYAHDYLFYILIGMVPFSLSIIFNNLSRAEGRAKVAMISMVIGASVNIILDPIFIFEWGLGLGVKGAAIATIIAKSAAFIYVFSQALSKRSNLKVNLLHLHHVDFSMVSEVSAIGFSSFIRNALGAVLVIVINRLIKYHATDPEIYISIFGVVNRLIMFILLPGFGLVQGLQPIVGFNFGAKNNKRLYDVIAYTLKLIIIYYSSVFILTQLFAKYVFMLFSEDATETFMQYGTWSLRIVSIGLLFVGFQVILSSVYQAMGYPVRAFLVAISRQFVLFIPIVFLLTYVYGIDGIWYTFLISDAIAGIGSLIVFRFEMKDLKKKIPETQVINS